MIPIRNMADVNEFIDRFSQLSDKTALTVRDLRIDNAVLGSALIEGLEQRCRLKGLTIVSTDISELLKLFPALFNSKSLNRISIQDIKDSKQDSLTSTSDQVKLKECLKRLKDNKGLDVVEVNNYGYSGFVRNNWARIWQAYAIDWPNNQTKEAIKAAQESNNTIVSYTLPDFHKSYKNEIKRVLNSKSAVIRQFKLENDYPLRQHETEHLMQALKQFETSKTIVEVDVREMKVFNKKENSSSILDALKELMSKNNNIISLGSLDEGKLLPNLLAVLADNRAKKYASENNDVDHIIKLTDKKAKADMLQTKIESYNSIIAGIDHVEVKQFYTDIRSRCINALIQHHMSNNDYTALEKLQPKVINTKEFQTIAFNNYLITSAPSIGAYVERAEAMGIKGDVIDLTVAHNVFANTEDPKLGAQIALAFAARVQSSSGEAQQAMQFFAARMMRSYYQDTNDKPARNLLANGETSYILSHAALQVDLLRFMHSDEFQAFGKSNPDQYAEWQHALYNYLNHNSNLSPAQMLDMTNTVPLKKYLENLYQTSNIVLAEHLITSIADFPVKRGSARPILHHLVVHLPTYPVMVAKVIPDVIKDFTTYCQQEVKDEKEIINTNATIALRGAIDEAGLLSRDMKVVRQLLEPDRIPDFATLQKAADKVIAKPGKFKIFTKKENPNSQKICRAIKESTNYEQLLQNLQGMQMSQKRKGNM